MNPKPGKPLNYIADHQTTRYLGLLVNPKLHDLVLALFTEPLHGVYEVYIVSPLPAEQLARAPVLGHGYFGYDEEAFERTGYPRAHCPDGVHPQRVGLGLMLYGAMALGAAYLNKVRPLEVTEISRTIKAGISSPVNDRSPSAEAFWKFQRERGLAHRMGKNYDFMTVADFAATGMVLDASPSIASLVRVPRPPPACLRGLEVSPTYSAEVREFVAGLCSASRVRRPAFLPEPARVNPQHSADWRRFFGDFTQSGPDPVE